MFTAKSADEIKIGEFSKLWIADFSYYLRYTKYWKRTPLSRRRSVIHLLIQIVQQHAKFARARGETYVSENKWWTLE